MSDKFLNQVADLLEKVAVHLDEEEAARKEAQRAERRKVANRLSEKIAASTGEALPDDLLEKLAASDQDIVDTVVKLAERQGAQPPDEMGEPGDINDRATVIRTKTAQAKEAAENADAQFMNWVMS
jgi:hypothetical protein